MTFSSTIWLGQYCRMCFEPLEIYVMSSNHFWPFLMIYNVCMLISDLSLHWWTIYEGQALGYLVRSTTLAPHENVAVPALGKLCPVKQGCRLSVLSFLPHHHYIRTGHTYLIPLNTINMTPSKLPVQNPVDIPFEIGIILTTTINPITCRHSIQCDLCEVIIDLGISASGSTIHKHRDHEPCRRTACKLKTQRARECIRVCMSRL